MATATKKSPWSERACALPISHFIGRSDDTKKLYAAEETISKGIEKASLETARLLEHDKNEYWKLTRATVLYAILENQQREASIAAAIAFLRDQGMIVAQGDATELPRGCKRLVVPWEDFVTVHFFDPTQQP